MSDLNSLNVKSILDMTPEEAMEHLRQIRLSRRTPQARPKNTVKKTNKAKSTAAIKTMSSEQANNLLKLLGESK